VARCAVEGGDFLCSSIAGDDICFYYILPATKQQLGIASVTLVSRKRNHGICRVFATRRHHQRCCTCETLQVPRYAPCVTPPRTRVTPQDSVRSHTARLYVQRIQKNISKPPSTSSPVLAPSDYHLLDFVQDQRQGQHCLSFCRREIFRRPERWQK